MRRGRIIIALVAAFAAACVALPTAALADGGTPMDICQDIQDGKLDGTYTVAQLQAFFSDPTVQGYCSPVVIVTPPPPPTTTTTTPPPTTTTTPCTEGEGGTSGAGGTGTGGSTNGSGASCSSTPPPPTTTTTTTTTTTSVPPPTAPTPVVSGVLGAEKTLGAPAKRTSHVQGAQHTVKVPTTSMASTAPASTVKKSGTLPFTGLQLSLFLVVGLGLLATGMVLRASGRRSSKD